MSDYRRTWENLYNMTSEQIRLSEPCGWTVGEKEDFLRELEAWKVKCEDLQEQLDAQS